MKPSGQPEELAPAYVFLVSQDSSFITGALIDVTGGQLSSKILQFPLLCLIQDLKKFARDSLKIIDWESIILIFDLGS